MDSKIHNLRACKQYGEKDNSTSKSSWNTNVLSVFKAAPQGEKRSNGSQSSELSRNKETVSLDGYKTLIQRLLGSCCLPEGTMEFMTRPKGR